VSVDSAHGADASASTSSSGDIPFAPRQCASRACLATPASQAPSVPRAASKEAGREASAMKASCVASAAQAALPHMPSA
jgi:hypothetical protein